jgi:hypothetical protein
MLTIMIPGRHKIGDTVDVKINGKPAILTWADADTLVINGVDRRRIMVSEESIDGTGNPVLFFAAGDSKAAIASGEAQPVLSIVTPEGVHSFRQR